MGSSSLSLICIKITRSRALLEIAGIITIIFYETWKNKPICPKRISYLLHTGDQESFGKSWCGSLVLSTRKDKEALCVRCDHPSSNTPRKTPANCTPPRIPKRIKATIISTMYHYSTGLLLVAYSPFSLFYTHALTHMLWASTIVSMMMPLFVTTMVEMGIRAGMALGFLFYICAITITKVCDRVGMAIWMVEVYIKIFTLCKKIDGW